MVNLDNILSLLSKAVNCFTNVQAFSVVSSSGRPVAYTFYPMNNMNKAHFIPSMESFDSLTSFPSAYYKQHAIASSYRG